MPNRARTPDLAEINLKLEVLLLKHQLNEVLEDLKELKSDQKELKIYMYNQQGSKAAFALLVTMAGAAGGLLTLIANYMFPISKIH